MILSKEIFSVDHDDNIGQLSFSPKKLQTPKLCYDWSDLRPWADFNQSQSGREGLYIYLPSWGILRMAGRREVTRSLRGRFNSFMAQETVLEVKKRQETSKASIFLQFIVFYYCLQFVFKFFFFSLGRKFSRWMSPVRLAHFGTFALVFLVFHRSLSRK